MATKTAAPTKTPRGVPLVVTTAKRGVFFGYGTPTEVATIRLERARMAVYWSADVRGVLGLAATGPTKDCRITAPVPAITLNEVTAVMEVTAEAATAWEAGFW
ncbi:MAG TPA: hypothetical protein VIU62_20210, partial [Chloroflexota bacterium]